MRVLPTIEEVAETRWKLILLLNKRLGLFLDLRRQLRKLFDPDCDEYKLTPEEKLAAVKRALGHIP